MITAMARPMYRPLRPAMAWPPMSKIALRSPSNATVFRVFLVVISLLCCGQGSSMLDPYLFLFEAQRARRRVHVGHYRIAGAERSAQELHCQRILNQALDRSPHGSRAVSRVVAFGQNQVDRGRSQLELQTSLGQ